MSLHARVLILARDDSLAGPLAEGLDRLGWRTVTARGVQAAVAALGDLQIEAAIIDTEGYGDAAEGLACQGQGNASGRVACRSSPSASPQPARRRRPST